MIEKDSPWVLLVIDLIFHTTASYIERSLQKICNVVTVSYDLYRWIPRREPLGLTPFVDALSWRYRVRAIEKELETARLGIDFNLPSSLLWA